MKFAEIADTTLLKCEPLSQSGKKMLIGNDYTHKMSLDIRLVGDRYDDYADNKISYCAAQSNSRIL